MNERYPTKLVVENIAGKAKLRKTAKASNLSSISQSTPGAVVTSLYGIDLAAWITWAIAEGLITTGASGDTHMMSTNLTSTITRTHVVGAAVDWSIWYSADFLGVHLDGGTSLKLGYTTDDQAGRIEFDSTGIAIAASNGNIITIGDTEGTSNLTLITIDDINSNIFLQSTDLISIGDVGAIGNSTTIEVNDDDQDVVISAASTSITGSNIYLTGDSDFWLKNITSGILIGDTENEGNSTLLTVDDSSSLITVSSVNTHVDGNLGINTATPGVQLGIQFDSLGVTQDATAGIAVSNTTAAAAGTQQMSPGIRWSGFGWKTNATAASQAVDFLADVLPVQGTAAPTGTWQLKSSINGGAYSTNMVVTSGGFVGLGGITAPVVSLHVPSGVMLSSISSGPWLFPVNGSNTTSTNTSGTGLSYYCAYQGHTGDNYHFNFVGGVMTPTSGSPRLVNIARTFSPTSGTATLECLTIAATINQTGGANGITRGIYIAPTLTAAADFRAIETTAGSVLLGGTTGFFRTPLMTAAQASALTPFEGAQVSVSDTDGTFTSTGAWIYEGGAWGKITVV